MGKKVKSSEKRGQRVYGAVFGVTALTIFCGHYGACTIGRKLQYLTARSLWKSKGEYLDIVFALLCRGVTLCVVACCRVRHPLNVCLCRGRTVECVLSTF